MGQQGPPPETLTVSLHRLSRAPSSPLTQMSSPYGLHLNSSPRHLRSVCECPVAAGTGHHSRVAYNNSSRFSHRSGGREADTKVIRVGSFWGLRGRVRSVPPSQLPVDPGAA